MKKTSLLLTLAAAGLLSLPAAHAADLSSGTFNGNFRYNDGTTTSTGTYVETHSTSGATTTDSVVYTITSTGATTTDTTVTTTNTDDSKTVVYTHIAFGATASFTATVSFPAYTTTMTTSGSTTTRTSASPYGTGTFTAADGTTGTLTTIVANGAIATDLTSATTGLTRDLRLECEGGNSSEQTYSVSPAGVLTITTLTRFSGGHHH